MFANQYLHVSALQFLLLLLVSLAAFATYKNRALSHIAVYGTAVWLLVFKIYEYSVSRRFPMDVSALCYFLYGACALLPIRSLKVAASQLSALCGLVFGVVQLCAPQIFSAREPSEMWRYFATVNHMLLLFGGLAMAGHVPFKKSDVFTTLGVLGAMISYTEICISMGVAEGNAVFSQIIDGSIILVAAPAFSIKWWYYFLYYPVVIFLLGLWLSASYFLNSKAVKGKKAGIFAL